MEINVHNICSILYIQCVYRFINFFFLLLSLYIHGVGWFFFFGLFFILVNVCARRQRIESIERTYFFFVALFFVQYIGFILAIHRIMKMYKLGYIYRIKIVFWLVVELTTELLLLAERAFPSL